MAVKELRSYIKLKRKDRTSSKLNARFLTCLDPSQFQIDVNWAGFWWFLVKKELIALMTDRLCEASAKYFSLLLKVTVLSRHINIKSTDDRMER